MAAADSSKRSSIRQRLAWYFPTIAIAVGVIMLWEFLGCGFRYSAIPPAKTVSHLRRVLASGGIVAGAGRAFDPL